jgi:hypothetical protein
MKKIEDPGSSKAQTISKIFNYVGGTLVFFGILYLLFNNIFLLATASRVLVTLGLAVWSLAIAVSMSKQEKAEATSAVFYTIGGLLLPVGFGVSRFLLFCSCAFRAKYYYYFVCSSAHHSLSPAQIT